MRMLTIERPCAGHDDCAPRRTCRQGHEPAPGEKKLLVVTTLFPLYDFVRTVGGDRVEARLLLPPGVEPHNFEPRPEDVVLLDKADSSSIPTGTWSPGRTAS